MAQTVGRWILGLSSSRDRYKDPSCAIQPSLLGYISEVNNVTIPRIPVIHVPHSVVHPYIDVHSSRASLQPQDAIRTSQDCVYNHLQFRQPSSIHPLTLRRQYLILSASSQTQNNSHQRNGVFFLSDVFLQCLSPVFFAFCNIIISGLVFFF